MEYQNQQPDEGLNVTRHNPVFHLLKLLFAALVFIVVLMVVVNLLASRLGRTVPFKYELSLMNHVTYDFSGGSSSQKMQDYLNDLAIRLKAHMDIPEGMSIVVHHNGDDVFNAFATLGGNVVFYSGLLKNLPHENAIAMVMAHEIAHVVHRDPAAGLGGGLAAMMALMAITGNTGTGAVGSVLNQTGAITQSKFSRDMEREADKSALAAVAAQYGHVAGADELFKVLQNKQSSGSGDSSNEWYETFSSTHPLNEERIDSITELALENEWSLNGEITPLPAGYHSWLN